ncbi:MAG: hypothetical protein C0629_00945, partial [Chromatiales bacterium]
MRVRLAFGAVGADCGERLVAHTALGGNAIRRALEQKERPPVRTAAPPLNNTPFLLSPILGLASVPPSLM